MALCLACLSIPVSAQKSLDRVDRESFGAGPSPLEMPAERMARGHLAHVAVESTGCVSLDGTWTLEGAEEANAGVKVEAGVPCSIHTALVNSGVIPDPLVARNDTIAERCSYRKWTLSRTFEYYGSFVRPVLYFEGVANKCRVYLNDTLLGAHEGMFGGPEYDLSGKLVNGTNSIRVELDNIGEFCDWNSSPNENGNWKYTVVINCVYGWHYSKIPSLGIWNSVSIRDNWQEMEHPFIATRSLDGEMNLSFNLKDTLNAAVELAVRPKGSKARWQTFKSKSVERTGFQSFDFRISNPRLWWPNGTGEQNVYEAVVRLKRGGKVISEKRTDFGIRTIEMAPFPEGPQEDLYNWTFVVNGRPMFVKGTGWCTCDVLLDFSRERYLTFLQAARDQHVQILRAWGGGLPETDTFYDICDSLGIMVIQEWPTAWGTHDVQPYDVLEETVVRNTLRIRNHPSLVMWGAGNETAWPFGKAIDMMGRKSIELDGTRPFHRGEPWGGSAHNYKCWWEGYPIDHNLTMTARFWGEFGLPSFPDRETMEHYLQGEVYSWPPRPGSILEHHTPTFNGQGDVVRSEIYTDAFLDTDTMDKLILASQMSQAEGVRHTLERARTMWPETTGALSYKLNDNYPAMSWSTIDYYGRKKLGHYTTKMAFEPLTTVLLFDKCNLAGGPVSLPYWFLDDMEVMAGKELNSHLRVYNREMQAVLDTAFAFTAGGRVMKIADVLLSEEQTSSDILFFVSDLYSGHRQLNRNWYVMNYTSHRGALLEAAKADIEVRRHEGSIVLANVSEVPAAGVRAADSFLWLDPGQKIRIPADRFTGVSGFNLVRKDIVLRKGNTVLLPIEDKAREAGVAVVSETGDTIGVPWKVRLAVGETDYFIPYTAECDVLLRISGLPDLAVYDRDVRMGGEAECRYNPSPSVHFKPLYGWINDPNGLVYKDGEWHLFYQFNPFGATWGNMTWGHAVSRDLVNWVHLPNAIEPDDLGTIFSGSAVTDTGNTAGFGAGAMVAFYTSDGAGQTQCLAYSTDNGRTFTKYPGNPILTSDEYGDFRDPHVFWHEESQHWIMLTCAGIGVNIYSSENLTDWKFESHFGGEGTGCRNSVWECPDLFRMGSKWVLMISNVRDWVNGQATQYLVGQFDGHEFVADDPRELWLDAGCDFYAAVTWNNAPGGRRIAIGWASNWQYAHETSTAGWRGMMSVPRELSLGGYNGRLTLFASPVPEILANLTADNSCTAVLSADNPVLEIAGVTLAFDSGRSEFSLVRPDRTMTAVLEPREKHDLLVIFQDDLVECFIDGGAVCVTCLSRI